MRAKLALGLHLCGVGECGRLIYVWSVQAQGWMRTCTHIRNQGIYSNAQIRRKGRQTRAKNVGSILYYARAVDMMVLMALSSIAWSLLHWQMLPKIRDVVLASSSSFMSFALVVMVPGG